jgi:hypothetical protein
MPEENTEAPTGPVVRSLLDRFCATLLHHDYPRLTHPPLNLQTDELLSANGCSVGI